MSTPETKSRFSFFSSLKWRLTLSAGFLLALAATIMLYVTHSLVTDLDGELVRALKARATANAKSVANAISFDLATKERASIQNKLKTFRAKNAETNSLAVVSKIGRVFVKEGADLDAEALLERLPRLKTGGARLLDDVLVTVWPVRMDDEKKTLNGYVVYTESLASYRAKISRRVTISYIVSISLFAALLVGVFLMGYREAAPMARLAEASQRIAAGDLREVDIALKGSSETRHLAAAIREMAAALQGQVQSIKEYTGKVSTVANEVAGAMAHLASSAVEQAAAVTETASTVEEMENAGKTASESAGRITEASEKTTEASHRGRSAVEETSRLIVQIKEDSSDISRKSQEVLTTIEEISKIISSVNDIAEQSKILAVNASIEAAKAGEYGAGFAVVAQEVKDLALQSKDATVQINATLNAARQAITSMVTISETGARRSAEGVKVIANAGAIVNDLSEAIRENAELAVGIATTIKQQAVGLTQIASAVNQINSSSLENQDISRRINDETTQLAESVQALGELVGRWQTPDSDQG